MQVTDEVRHAVEEVIRDRFGDKVESIEISVSSGEQGDEVLLIRVLMSEDTKSSDFSNRFFGLTGRVRNALGGEMRGLFPVIRPV